MNRAFTEFVVEQAALARFESTGWAVRNGAEIAPGELRVKDAERFVGRAT